MDGIKAYLMRIILCGFLVSLGQGFLQGRQGKKVLTLCGGCLMILTVLQPLLRVDLNRLPNLWKELERAGFSAVQEGSARNDEILRQMVEGQTEQWLTEQTEDWNPSLRFSVTAVKKEEGLFVPWEVVIRGSDPERWRQRLATLLEALDIPPERQRWVME